MVVALCFLTSVFVPITKLMFDRKADLEKVHPAAKELDPKVAVDTAPVELAPGTRTALQGLGAADRESRRRGVRTTRPERAVRACPDRRLVHQRVWTRGQWCAT